MIRFLKILFKTIFPRKCLGCKAPDFWICEKCLQNIPHPDISPKTWIYSVFSYKSKVLRKAIWNLKFSEKYTVLGDIESKLRKDFSIFLNKNNLQDTNFYLIPIPITERSRRSRGYNQSFLIAKKLVKKNKILENVLIKTKNHKPQNKIKNRNERLRNIVGSFDVKKGAVPESATLVLVDDVVTTGATLSEARKVLRKDGVKKVFAFVVAH